MEIFGGVLAALIYSAFWFFVGVNHGYDWGYHEGSRKSLPLCVTSSERVFLLHLLRRTKEEMEADLRERN